jgi:hypothetical protein
MYEHLQKNRTKYGSFFIVALLVSIVTYSLYETKAQTVPTFVQDIRPVGSGYVELSTRLSPWMSFLMMQEIFIFLTAIPKGCLSFLREARRLRLFPLFLSEVAPDR